MQIVADVGGIPGKDCNGFCKYCYFRKVKKVKSFGCAYCPPNKIRCLLCRISLLRCLSCGSKG